jgi:hypothetical protein
VHRAAAVGRAAGRQEGQNQEQEDKYQALVLHFLFIFVDQ